MAVYNEKEQFHLKMDVSGVGLGASLLQPREGMGFPRNEAPYNATLCPIACTHKSLAKYIYLLKQLKEVLGILHGLENFKPFYFASKINMIIDHKYLEMMLQAYHIGFKE